ncbi:hypothetical protein DAEQUDRAFT_677331 [Daedalea quercina L-15889]|uniref:Uncharacterized protein n=1 Tax=Daedalea quercina L-15889 TaxID=1314783 RepID=A0A165M2Q9_9APHY|nr:hypothetical protein DAEQUDRAFT_677331 [Daedalea quercina L-15889]
MQAYHNGDAQYYAQSGYAQPQPAYYAQFTPYPPYQSQPVAAPFPTYPQAAQYDSPKQFPTPGPVRRKLSHGRTASTAPTIQNTPSRTGTPAAPLKSAMKKQIDRSASTGAVPLARRSTNESRQRVNSLTRPRSRTGSINAFVPDHIFVSLHSAGELRIDNIAYQSTLDDLRELVLPMWPHGIEVEDSRGDGWRVRFARSPWTSVGIDGMLAQRLICTLYTVLARQGYSHVTTVQNGSPRPGKLVFVETQADPDVKIFATMFSPSKMRLRLLDAPRELVEDFASSLRPMFPRKVMSYGANEDGVHVIEVKREGFRSHEAERNLFYACMLRFFNSAGFKLDGSIPLGRKDPMFWGSRKEAWIFRSLPMRRPESRQKQ